MLRQIVAHHVETQGQWHRARLMAERWSALQSEPCARRDSNPTSQTAATPILFLIIAIFLTSAWLPACLSCSCFYPSSELIYRTSAPDQWESLALRKSSSPLTATA